MHREGAHNIVGLYLSPSERALVFYVYENSQIQVPDRNVPLLLVQPGHIERRPYDHVRRGNTTLSVVLDTKSDVLIVQTQHRQCWAEFRRFLDTIEQNAPSEMYIHLIMDNYGTPKRQLIGNAPLCRDL